DIKKAIACLLIGRYKKVLPNGIKLRSNINILLFKGPGTAKSQLLKFVKKVTPIAIYTSGKKLRGNINRDKAIQEFYLEGRAIVLVDGGAMCISEFNKMRNKDRVAIYEAIE
ncbi:MCM-domain-containing protein, partial [Lepidopterella palustris CBS 459.81]